MAGTKAPTAFTSFGSPSEPAIEKAVLAINSVFNAVSPDFSTLTPNEVAKLNGAYKEITNYLAVAKASGDQKKIDTAEHWLKQLNLPRDDSASKLVFLEGRLNGLGNKQTEASNILASIIGSQVNKASMGAQKAAQSV
ncbi:MAG: hypothetical protein WC263_05455 [Candidatus Micrarchaeia archaeon]